MKLCFFGQPAVFSRLIQRDPFFAVCVPDFQQGTLAGIEVRAVAGISAGHEQTVDQRVIDDYRMIASRIVDGLQVVYALIALVAVKQLIVIQEALADKGEVLVEFLLRAFLREGDEGVEADIGQGLLMRLGGWGTASERDVKRPDQQQEA